MGIADKKKAVAMSCFGTLGNAIAASRSHANGTTKAKSRRPRSALRPATMSFSCGGLVPDTDGINGIPFQPNTAQTPPTTMPGIVRADHCAIAPPIFAMPNKTQAARAQFGRGWCHRMSFMQLSTNS
jgi:hypothetical protein